MRRQVAPPLLRRFVIRQTEPFASTLLRKSAALLLLLEPLADFPQSSPAAWGVSFTSQIRRLLE